MITASTTEVYVRVDLASMRVIGVSDEVLITRPGKPVFKVSANFAKLDYYVVEKNAAATYGITVRPATAAERTAIDAKLTESAAAATAKAKAAKAKSIKSFFCEMFLHRFVDRGFSCTAEITAAAGYTGTDTTIIDDVKPLAISIDNASVEWRHLVCQPAIDAMLADAGMGLDLNDDYRSTIEDQLDTFLTDRSFDTAVYHR